MALTATANEQTVADIMNRLSLRACVKLTSSFNRPNLRYEVRPKRGQVVLAIANFIQSHHPGASGVIYCLSRNKCEEVAKELREQHGLSARHFHAQMSKEDKARAQREWQEGACKIIVATIAFGMGIGECAVSSIRSGLI